MMRRRAVVLASVLVLAGVSAALYLVRKPYSLCEIAQDPTAFAGRAVVIKGTLYGYSGGLIHLSGSGCEDTDAWATIEFPESFEPDSETEDILTHIRSLPNRREYLKTEVTVVGDLNDLGNACFAPRFVIRAKRLQKLTPTTIVGFPSGNAQWNTSRSINGSLTKIPKPSSTRGSQPVLGILRTSKAFDPVYRSSFFHSQMKSLFTTLEFSR